MAQRQARRPYVVFHCVLLAYLAIGHAQKKTYREKIVPKKGQVSIPCPTIPSQTNVTIILELGKKTLSTVVLDTARGSGVLFSGEFKVEPRNGTFECTMMRRYPPPIGHDVDVTTVRVIEGGVASTAPPATTAAPPPKISSSSPFDHMILWWAACGALLLYSLSITCFLAAKRVKGVQMVKEKNVVYANTNPRKKPKSEAK